jgi:hypothetical protein
MSIPYNSSRPTWIPSNIPQRAYSLLKDLQRHAPDMEILINIDGIGYTKGNDSWTEDFPVTPTLIKEPTVEELKMAQKKTWQHFLQKSTTALKKALNQKNRHQMLEAYWDLGEGIDKRSCEPDQKEQSLTIDVNQAMEDKATGLIAKRAYYLFKTKKEILEARYLTPKGIQALTPEEIASMVAERDARQKKKTAPKTSSGTEEDKKRNMLPDASVARITSTAKSIKQAKPRSSPY